MDVSQAEYWNEQAGPVWVDLNQVLDAQVEPLGAPAMAMLALKAGETVLDIGCGCGQTSWQLAQAVGSEGAVEAVDLSAPMLAVARARTPIAGAARPRFRQADAETDALGAGFDAAFSRFGVMFFPRPAAAFANIRRAVKPGGRLAFVCWRSVAENPMMRAPAEAAAPFLPSSPPTDPHEPGPFAFADGERTRRLLAEAGWADVAVRPADIPVGGQPLEGATDLALRIGPLGAAVRRDPALAEKVRPAVRAGLEGYVASGKVWFPAAVWMVSARNPG